MFKKIIKNKILQNFVLATALALLIVFGVLWWLKYYTNHGEKIETPNFIGLQVSDAQKVAEKNNIQLVLDSVYYEKAPKGSIYIQNPIPHSDTTPSWVKPNRKIYVTYVRNDVQVVSLPDIDASEMVVVPRLTGLFKIKKEYIPGDEKVLKCTYNGEEVKKGDKIPRGAELTLYIGQEKIKKPVSLPNLVGLTINDANLKLVDKGLSLVEVYMNDCPTKMDSTNAKIIQQTPEYHEGATILQGKDIVIQLYCGELPE